MRATMDISIILSEANENMNTTQIITDYLSESIKQANVLSTCLVMLLDDGISDIAKNIPDKLFTKWNGEPIHPDTLTAWFSKFLKKNNLRHVTLNSLRHTNASLLIAAGTDVRTVSNRLGHAQTSTTLNLYTHALKSKDIEAADNLEIILKKAD